MTNLTDNKMKVLSLYDYSGVMVQPWIEHGYVGVLVDIQHMPGISSTESTIWVGGDVLKWEEVLKQTNNVCFIAAFPPCTDLAVSGARWFAQKRVKNPQFQKQAMDLFYAAKRIAEKLNVPYMIENPVSVAARLWRKPDYYFHPYQYSGYSAEDSYTKKTCLWTGNDFVMPEPYYDPSIKPDDRIHKMAPSSQRRNLRSRTPLGFARAVYYANTLLKTSV